MLYKALKPGDQIINQEVKKMKKVLIIVTMLLLVLTAAFAAAKKEVVIKRDLGKGKISQTAWTKLVGPLKDAVKIYRKQPKIHKNPAAVRAAKEKTRFQQPFLAEMLVDSRLQKQWKNPSYDVLKCLIKVSGNPEVLKDHHVKIRSVSDLGKEKIVSVEMSALNLEKVAALPEVVSISPVIKKMPSNDVATDYIGASALRVREGDEFVKGYTGKGVIIGLIDTGLDLNHQDLRDENGTRVLYLWDPFIQTPGKTPADIFGGVLSGYDYGTVWSKEEIDAGLCTSRDDYGHGTHVFGVAAGRGRIKEEYAGVAPNADIIAVKEDLTHDGVLFVYELSKRLNKPCVVNVSMTSYTYLHVMAMYPGLFPADGTEAESLQIKGWNQAYGPGHIPVVSAGNYGHWNSYTNVEEFPYLEGAFHAEAPLSASSSHLLKVPDYEAFWASYGYTQDENLYSNVRIGVWYESPIQVTFISPNGNVIGPMQHGSSGTAADNVSQDGVVNYVLDNPKASNGDYYGTFDLGDYFWTNFCPEPGEWTILVEPLGNGCGQIDMWCADVVWYYGDWYPILGKHPLVLFTNGTHSKYILDVGASPDVITVGGWVTKNQWIGLDGTIHSFPQGYILGSVLTSSSPGPARNGVIKPDISAPGTVTSCLTTDFFYYDEYIIEEGGNYAIFNGTSAAAPVVVGGVALILEKYPTKSVEEVKEMIKDFAINDSFTAEYGPNAFGHGKFNILPLNERPVAVVSATQTENTIVFDASASYDPEEFTLTYDFKVETMAVEGGQKPKAYTTTLSQDGTILTLVPDPDVYGYYRVKLRVNDGITNSKKVYSDWILIQE
jgi:subtilisin family serine protease